MSLLSFVSVAGVLVTWAAALGGAAILFRSEAGKALLALKGDTIQTLQAEATSLRGQYSDACAKIVALEQRLTDLEQTHQQQLTSLRQDAAKQLETVRREAADQIAAKDEEIARLQKTLAQERATTSRLQTRLRKAEERIAQLERRVPAEAVEHA